MVKAWKDSTIFEKKSLFFRNSNIKNKNMLVASLDQDFELNLAFLTDITCILNELNLVLQGKNLKIFELVTIINHFSKKLQLLIRELDKIICPTLKERRKFVPS